MATTTPTSTPASGAWAPFGERSFLVLWSATLVSNIGTWMHDVGAGWLMTTLSPSPLMVALVQAATALPVFLFALPAGALADLADRRRILMAVTAVALVIALAFGLVVAAGAAAPWSLLLATLAMGTCAALTAPTWQSIVPQLVARPQLQAALALNSMGVNISRAIGPALAGVLIVTVGLAWPFIVNAASFAFVLAALWWWMPPATRASTLPPEHVLGALRAGLRYARHSPPLIATLVRAVAFFLPASAVWALLPLVARTQLGGEATLYGILLACVGGGAVAGAMCLPRVKAKLSPDRLMGAASALTALVALGIALVPNVAAAVAAALGLGLAWIAALSTLNVSAQTALPDWVRARGLAVFVTVFFGSMTAGSVLWGQLAALTSIPTALVAASVGLLVGILVSGRHRLQQGAALDLTPSSHWPTPQTAIDPGADRGPVLVTIDYEVDPADRTDFLDALSVLADERRRDGGYGWGVFEDAVAPGRFREQFYTVSWLDHLRQHERVTHADRELQDRVNAFHRGDPSPKVTHHFAPERGRQAE
jgi:predicted MFS family arabinose efflux permease